jgi:hypothetical protein
MSAPPAEYLPHSQVLHAIAPFRASVGIPFALNVVDMRNQYFYTESSSTFESSLCPNVASFDGKTYDGRLKLVKKDSDRYLKTMIDSTSQLRKLAWDLISGLTFCDSAGHVETDHE